MVSESDERVGAQAQVARDPADYGIDGLAASNCGEVVQAHVGPGGKLRVGDAEPALRLADDVG